MKINEILTESQQLDEGPLDTVGKYIGKGVGGAAKAVGAVAGGVAGLGRAFKKGYAGGKATVAGDPSPNADDDSTDTTTTNTTNTKTSAVGGGTAPAATTGGGSGYSTPTPQPTGDPKGYNSAAELNKAGPKGAPPAKVQTGAAAQAMAKTAQATADQDAGQAGQTMYAQVKANIDKLDKKGKQRILQLLQKSLTQPSPADQKAPAAGAGAGAFGQMANQLAKGGTAEPNTMAGAPVSKTNTAKPGNPNAAAEPAATTAPAPAPAADAEQPTTAAGKKKPAPRKKAAPSQAEIDADRARLMGTTSDSIIRKGNLVSEGRVPFSFFKPR